MSDIGWHIVETANQRVVYDGNNTPIIEIRYFATDEQQYIINTKTGEIYTLGMIQPVKASWNKKSKDKIFRD